MLVGVFILFAFLVSSAEAITVNQAVTDGVTVTVKGREAAPNAPMSWEGTIVQFSNGGGNFNFQTNDLPQDCIGTLSDGVTTLEVVVANCQPGAPPVVPTSATLATGQTQSFAANTSDAGTFVPVPDDGAMQLGVPLQYVDNGDGTVTDLNTGLMWEKKDDSGGLHDKDNTYTWSGDGTEETIWDWIEDVNAEGGTGFAGYNDWRIPNVRELASIVNYGVFNPSIDAIFGPTAAAAYWSSTTFAGNTNLAWFVNLFGGNVVSGDKALSFFVIAVRGGP
jgi:hypothetical protein